MKNEIKADEIQFNVPMKYKDICAMFNCETKTGKSKILQLDRWNKTYEVIKDKTWYTVLRERTDEEKIALASTKEYTIYIENILIDLLKHLSDEADKNHVRFSYHELFEKLGITNEMYYKILYGNKKDKDKNSIKEDYILGVKEANKIDFSVVSFNLDIFFSESQTLLKRMIDDAIKSIEQKMLIVSSKSYRLFTKVTLPNGKIKIEKHDCTDEETEQILYIYHSLLKKYHVEKINEIYGLDKPYQLAYFFEVEQKINQTFHCNNHCKTFDIVLTRKGINEEYNELLIRNKLNNNVQNKLVKSKVLNNNVVKPLLQIFIDDLIRK